MSDLDELIEWLKSDDEDSRDFRAQRLQKLIELNCFPDKGILFVGGSGAAEAFSEIRAAYINGLNRSTVLLALACIEHELAGALRMRGVEAASTARLEKLLKESRKLNLITEAEHNAFDRLRDIRNSLTHFRDVSNPMALLRRSMAMDMTTDDILEEDAITAITALSGFIERKSPF